MDLQIEGVVDVEELKSGPSSTIYRAHHVDLERQIAIKVFRSMDQEFLSRFESDAKNLVSLSADRRIATVYGSGLTGSGQAFLLMELCESSLTDVLVDEGPMAALRACDVLVDVARAIATAHDENVVHGNLRPDKVLVDANQELNVADFGLWYGSLSVGTNTNDPYVAPEVNPSGAMAPSADIYAFGTLLGHAIDGTTPTAADDGNDAGPVPELSLEDVPDSIRDIVRWCRETDPTERPTAETLVARIESAVDSERLYDGEAVFDLNWLDGSDGEAMAVVDLDALDADTDTGTDTGDDLDAAETVAPPEMPVDESTDDVESGVENDVESGVDVEDEPVDDEDEPADDQDPKSDLDTEADLDVEDDAEVEAVAADEPQTDGDADEASEELTSEDAEAVADDTGPDTEVDEAAAADADTAPDETDEDSGDDSADAAESEHASDDMLDVSQELGDLDALDDADDPDDDEDAESSTPEPRLGAEDEDEDPFFGPERSTSDEPEPVVSDATVVAEDTPLAELDPQPELEPLEQLQPVDFFAPTDAEAEVPVEADVPVEVDADVSVDAEVETEQPQEAVAHNAPPADDQASGVFEVPAAPMALNVVEEAPAAKSNGSQTNGNHANGAAAAQATPWSNGSAQHLQLPAQQASSQQPAGPADDANLFGDRSDLRTVGAPVPTATTPDFWDGSATRRLVLVGLAIAALILLFVGILALGNRNTTEEGVVRLSAEGPPEPTVSSVDNTTVVEVPLLLGKSESDAVSALAIDGFKVNVTYEDAPGQQAGRVIDQEPAAGTTLDFGAEVELTLSRNMSANGFSAEQEPETSTGEDAVVPLTVPPAPQPRRAPANPPPADNTPVDNPPAAPSAPAPDAPANDPPEPEPTEPAEPPAPEPEPDPTETVLPPVDDTTIPPSDPVTEVTPPGDSDQASTES